jgi:hypothetical protein
MIKVQTAEQQKTMEQILRVLREADQKRDSSLPKDKQPDANEK